MKYYCSNIIKCPYYRHEKMPKIHCQGVRENSLIHLAFGNPTDYKEYRSYYCSDNYERCEVYKMLANMEEG